MDPPGGLGIGRSSKMSGPMAKIVTFMVASRGSDGKRMVRANVEPEVLLVTTCTHRICSSLFSVGNDAELGSC